MNSVFHESCKCLAKKHLSPSLFKKLKTVKTDSGFTLEKAIASGIKNPDSSIGIYAGDAQSYELFSAVMEPISKDYHPFFDGTAHTSGFNCKKLTNLDPDCRYIKSTRIRVARNLDGFNFPCNMRLQERKNLETEIILATRHLTGNLKGKYLSFKNLSDEQSRKLESEKLIFPKGDRFQDAAGFNSDFPAARGVFLSQDQQFRVWVNEEDHLRLISMEPSANLFSVFNRLKSGLNTLEKHLCFSYHPVYGYLCSCPTNLGTAMRASVHIKLKNLSQNKDKLRSLANQYHLQIRGTAGEKTKVTDAVFDISNKHRLGISESSILLNLQKGVEAIISAEQKL